MLPPAHRLTDGASFREAVRTGRRSGTRTVVVHLATSPSGDGPPRVGFVVSKAVGNAVLRNRVKRRLRHLAREHVSSLPGSAVLVVRALPAAGSASAAELGADLARCLRRVQVQEVDA
ncbi:ribonuclease P protein component [Nocardioides aquiterrae]|uniref:Ribonuclease P protein component n=1 Tax=Nocardioides aquiterrae TaxID=203799 RepID=A0ABN1U6W3_9ACTN